MKLVSCDTFFHTDIRKKTKTQHSHYEHAMSSPSYVVSTVEEDSLLGDESVCSSHLVQNFCHPVLHTTFSSHRCLINHLLFLGWDHTQSCHLIVRLVLRELESWDVIIHLNVNIKCYVINRRKKLNATSIQILVIPPKPLNDYYIISLDRIV